MSIYPYRTQQVRDLAWACFSPALLLTPELTGGGQRVDNCGLSLTPDRDTWLQTLDRNPGALLAHLANQRSHRLGIYFEHLWHFFLEQDPAVELLAHNLPIRHEGKTLGEFDCLYFCHTRQRVYHLELAVKFFLGHRQFTTDETTSSLREWLGPSSDDRLDLKVAHLLQRQIRLGENPMAQQQLQDLGITDLHKEVEIKGQLFHSVADPLPAPNGFNPDLQPGHYVAISGLSGFLQAPGQSCFAGYKDLPKTLWLSPVQVDPPTTLAPEAIISRLHHHFDQDKRSQLVAALDHQGGEIHRFFVTPPNWPAKANTASQARTK